MPLVRDRSLCLRKTEYSETSQIITLLTREHGIVRLIAKGAHRRTKAGASKFDGGVDFLDLGDAVFSHDPARDLPPLTEWSLREGHLDLRRTLRGVYLGLYAAELVWRLFEEHDPHPELFDRLATTIPLLATSQREEVFLAFQLDMLRQSGDLPELFACAVCGGAIDARRPVYLSAALGGVLCTNCQQRATDRVALDGRLLGLLQTLLRLPRRDGEVMRLPQLTRHQTDPIHRVLANHVAHTLGRRLSLPRWILDEQPRNQR